MPSKLQGEIGLWRMEKCIAIILDSRGRGKLSFGIGVEMGGVEAVVACGT